MSFLSSVVISPLRITLKRARASRVGWILNWRFILAMLANVVFWYALVNYLAHR
jgi:hypothetical protein